MKKTQGITWRTGVAVLGMVVLFFLFSGRLLTGLFGEYGRYLADLGILIIGLVAIWMTKTPLRDVASLKPVPFKTTAWATGVMIGASLLTSAIGQFLSVLIPDFGQRDAGIDAFVVGIPPLLAILIFVVQPAICEEFVFRGVLTKAFSFGGRQWLTVLVVGVLFAALHLDLATLIPLSVLGCAYTLIGLKTGSLLLPILFHALNNGWALYTALTAAGGPAEDPVAVPSPRVTLSMATLVAAISLPFLLLCGAKLCRKKTTPRFRWAVLGGMLLLLLTGQLLLRTN